MLHIWDTILLRDLFILYSDINVMLACMHVKSVNLYKFLTFPAFGIGSVYLQCKAHADIFAVLNALFCTWVGLSVAVSPNEICPRSSLDRP